MTTREIQDEILRLKKEKEVCILAHAYQNHEILEVADYMGDSFTLSQQAAKTQEQTILMCGVRFMAVEPMDGTMVSNMEETIFGFRPSVWAMALDMSTS